MYSGGSGTSGDPYLIANATDLKNIESNMSAYFKQIADIDLGGTFEPIGYVSGSPYYTAFFGFYDGDNYIIKNAEISYPSDRYIGIFSYANNDIVNVKLENIKVDALYYSGCLAGGGESAQFIRISTNYQCSSTSGYAGGIVGILNNISDIQKSFNYATVVCKENVSDASAGGLAGLSTRYNEIFNCVNYGEVTTDDQANDYSRCGGIIGYVANSSSTNYSYINRCLNFGNITAHRIAGGIVGRINSTNEIYVYKCISLNDNIIRSIGYTNTSFHRIIGSISISISDALAENYALDTMTEPFAGAFDDKLATGQDGEDLTNENALLQSTYIAIDWEFPPWHIINSYPFVLEYNAIIPSTPDITVNSYAPSIQSISNVALSDKFTIQRIFDIYLFDLSNGQVVGKLNNLKDTNFINEEVVVYATGGIGNSPIVGFNYSKHARIDVSSMVYDLMNIGTQLDCTPITGMNDEFIYGDKIYVENNQALTTYTPVGSAGVEINYIYELNYGDILGTEYTQDIVLSPGKFTYDPSSKTISFYPGEIADGTQIMLYYRCQTDANAKTLSNYTNLFSKHVKMVAKGVVKNICTKENYIIEIIFYNSKIEGNFNIDLIVDGKVASHNVMIEAVSNCANDKLWDMIISA